MFKQFKTFIISFKCYVFFCFCYHGSYIFVKCLYYFSCLYHELHQLLSQNKSETFISLVIFEDDYTLVVFCNNFITDWFHLDSWSPFHICPDCPVVWFMHSDHAICLATSNASKLCLFNSVLLFILLRTW